MGKSSHKSKKRRRSSSRDRLAALEAKVARLVESLSRSEVSGSRSLSSSLRSVSTEARQTDKWSGIESQPENICLEEISNQENCIPRDNSLVVPARQERPGDSLTVLVSSEGECSPAPPPVESVTRAVLPVTITQNEDLANALSKELFGADSEDLVEHVWNEHVIAKWRELSSKGMQADERTVLLKKYSPLETLAFLKAPSLNPECKSALKNNSIIKRDEFNAKDQDQVGIALCAFGEAISDFLKPELQLSLSSETRSAIVKVHEGAKILADLFYRLSLSRRAQIKPAFNLLAKTTVDVIPADSLLFGTSFGEEIKKASAMEKSSKDIVKTPLVIQKKVLQPIKQPGQVAASKEGNARAPAPRTKPAVARRAGASSSNRRVSYRSRSHSRRH
ncbi:hypothetical protein ALC62_15033 [Cyphomyrmex costatus]|uniref:Uncharacterized protein n=1 Tax=Cyphomyrmex costatus TaxID=456900 RepID=A0A151I861_9HYME|nr:hypothetical protein ALC62_15033 [Cyphomyrmex costatus]